MNQACHIRAYQPGDLSRLQEIRASAFAPIFASFRSLVGDDIAPIVFAEAEQEQAALLGKICTDEASDEVFVALIEGAIIGFVSLTCDAEAKVGEIGLNAIDPAFQGKGIGAQLFEFALERMKSAGMKVATVGTGGDDSHAAARRAYEKVGFSAAIPNVYYYRTL